MEIGERLDKIEATLENVEKKIAELSDILEKLKVILPTWVKPGQKPILSSIRPVEAPKPVVVAVEAPKPVVVAVEAPKPVVVAVEAPKVPLLTELVNLLNSKQWPHAVDPTLICDISSDQDKEDRAEGILDLIIDIHLENLRFLDFGCGEGHVVNRSRSQKPKMTVGYDIKKSDKWDQWEKAGNVVLTTDWDDVKLAMPYNIILMYDVIDHMLCSDQELINKLKEIRQLLAPNAKVYVRTHPWCSRHGTHLYHQLNKAFAHLVFTDEELKSLGYNQDEVRKVKHPQQEYEKLFADSGFKILSGPNLIKEGVEQFFTNEPLIKERIKSHYPNENIISLENQFIDYILQ